MSIKKYFHCFNDNKALLHKDQLCKDLMWMLILKDLNFCK